MSDPTIIRKVSKKLDEKFLNSKYKRFIDYAKSKRKILKEIKSSLEYVLVDYLHEVDVTIIDLIDLNQIVIYINLIDKELNKKVTLYYEMKGTY